MCSSSVPSPSPFTKGLSQSREHSCDQGFGRITGTKVHGGASKIKLADYEIRAKQNVDQEQAGRRGDQRWTMSFTHADYCLVVTGTEQLGQSRVSLFFERGDGVTDEVGIDDGARLRWIAIGRARQNHEEHRSTDGERVGCSLSSRGLICEI